MLIQYLVDPNYSFDTIKKPNDPTQYEEISQAEKSILATRLRHYIEREARLASNRNIIYSIIC